MEPGQYDDDFVKSFEDMKLTHDDAETVFYRAREFRLTNDDSEWQKWKWLEEHTNTFMCSSSQEPFAKQKDISIADQKNTISIALKSMNPPESATYDATERRRRLEAISHRKLCVLKLGDYEDVLDPDGDGRVHPPEVKTDPEVTTDNKMKDSAETGLGDQPDALYNKKRKISSHSSSFSSSSSSSTSSSSSHDIQQSRFPELYLKFKVIGRDYVHTGYFGHYMTTTREFPNPPADCQIPYRNTMTIAEIALMLKKEEVDALRMARGPRSSKELAGLNLDYKYIFRAFFFKQGPRTWRMGHALREVNWDFSALRESVFELDEAIRIGGNHIISCHGTAKDDRPPPVNPFPINTPQSLDEDDVKYAPASAENDPDRRDEQLIAIKRKVARDPKPFIEGELVDNRDKGAKWTYRPPF